MTGEAPAINFSKEQAKQPQIPLAVGSRVIARLMILNAVNNQSKYLREKPLPTGPVFETSGTLCGVLHPEDDPDSPRVLLQQDNGVPYACGLKPFRPSYDNVQVTAQVIVSPEAS
jgi:hypothetical protein